MLRYIAISVLFAVITCPVANASPGAADSPEEAVPVEDLRPWRQEDILRTAPNESAAFVPIVKPAGNEPTVEVISRQGEWEEVRLRYWFKYNGSTKPGVCAMSLFEGTFTGFRKVSQ